MKTKTIKKNKLTINNVYIEYESYDGFKVEEQISNYENVLEFIYNVADNNDAGNELVLKFRKFIYDNTGKGYEKNIT